MPRPSTRTSPSPSSTWLVYLLLSLLTFYSELKTGGPGWQRETKEDEGGRGEVEGGHQHQHGSLILGQRHISVGGREERTRQSHPIQGFQIDQAVAGNDFSYWIDPDWVNINLIVCVEI